MFKKAFLILLFIIIIFTIKIEAGLIVNSKLAHQFEGETGEKKTGEIILENNSKNDIRVRLYKKDYSFNAKGKSFYRKPGRNSRSNAEWILFQKRSLSLSPFEKVTVKYIINIPDRQKLKGTYWSMVMVEEYEPQEKSGSKITERNFKQEIRYGIQIVTNFGKKENLKIEYKNPEVIKKKGEDYTFEIDIINKGIFELKMKPQIILINENTGEIIKKYKKKQVRLYPSTSIAIKEKIILDKTIPCKILVVVGNNRRGYYGEEYSIGVVRD